MAYDKIIPVRRRLDHCVDYILNPEKTDMGRVLEYIGSADKTVTPDGKAVLQTAIHCRLETACQEMQATKRRWDKRGGILGYHLIHSYAPGEVTPEQAHALGLEFVRQLLQDKYEAVVSTHLDHDHIHCHILFNSVSFLDGRKYRDNFQAYYGDIRGISNAVSREHGLSVITPEGKGTHYAEVNAGRKGKATVRGLIRQDIDAALAQSFTYATFLAAMRKQGYEIRSGPNVKHTAVKPPGGSRFIRLSSLGEGYSEAEIRERLSHSRTAPAQQPTAITAPKRYVVRRGGIPKRRRKLRGFHALYVHYLILLGIRKPGRTKKPLPFTVRKEVTKLHRYQQQFRLLQEYRIENDTQLSMLADALQADIDALTARRKSLYCQKRQGKDVTAEIDTINQALRPLRQKLKICTQIGEDIPYIREQISSCREESREKEAKHHEKRKPFERRL